MTSRQRPYTVRKTNRSGRTFTSTFATGVKAVREARQYAEVGWTVEVEHRPTGRIDKFEPSGRQ